MSNSKDYKLLLTRLRSQLGNQDSTNNEERFEIPAPQIQYVGRKTILRNYSEYPLLFRRPSNHLLLFLAKELATAASINRDHVIFVGKILSDSINGILHRYAKTYVICVTCQRPDTKLEKSKRLMFILCEACGARSPVKG